MEKQTKQCQNCNKEFIITPKDFEFYNKIQVPVPSFCPSCRLERRLAFRIGQVLYKRDCDLCKNSIVSMYNKDVPFPVYCSPCWWSDKWDPMNYGADYDFEKPFFEQFKELSLKVPVYNLSVSYNTLVNSPYNNMAHGLRNCYLLTNSDYNENCNYGTEIENSKDTFDNLMLDGSQLLYESINCRKCFKIFYSIDCESSHNIYFSKNLSGCSDCFGSVGLRNKQYYIFNKEYSKEEYFAKLKEFDIGSYKSITEFRDKMKELYLNVPYKYMHSRHNTNVTGDYIYNSKDVLNSYIATESENCKYCMWLIIKPNKDCYDYTQFGENTQNMYEALVC
ncbi:MAG: hypothetical protein AAB593_01375 [Patescibacteria group bacterium]